MGLTPYHIISISYHGRVTTTVHRFLSPGSLAVKQYLISHGNVHLDLILVALVPLLELSTHRSSQHGGHNSAL